MPRTPVRPPELFASEPFGFHQAVVCPPGRLVFVSGQVAWDHEQRLVGGADVAAQARQALANLGHALEAAGASPADVAMLRVYVVDYEPRQAEALSARIREFFGDAALPSSTWLGVQALAAPELLVEIEAVAVLSP